MLSDLVTAMTVLVLALTLYFAIRTIVMLRGLTVPNEEKKPLKPKKKPVRDTQFEEMVRRANIVRENVDNYNGTSYGQKEVK